MGGGGGKPIKAVKSVELGEKGHWGVLEGGLDSRVLGVRGQGILKFLIPFCFL